MQEQSALLSNLINSAMDAIVSTDENQNIVMFNHAAELMFGHRAADIIGQPLEKLVPARFHAMHRQHVENFGRTGITTRTMNAPGVSYGLRANDEEFIFEASISVVDIVGKKTYTAILRDITERKQAEEALRFERDRAQAYLDTVETLIVALDTEGRITTINKKGCQFLGWQEDELIGKKWFTTCLPQPEGMEEVFPHFLKIISGELDSVEHFENPVLTRGGELRQIAWHNALLRDNQGRITGTLSAGENITERKRAEVDLRIAATAFESQESMVITDANGVILKVNQAFTEATGYTAEEAVGQTPRILKSGRQDADFYREMWGTLLRTGKWQGEIWDRRKNGEIYPKMLTISAVKGDDGVVTHYVGADHDITKRKAAEEEINRLAFYDSLTQLPNRRLLDDRLGKTMAASKRSGRYGAVMFLDLDNFKPLNDLHGHNVGDLLLIEVAHRLSGCVREVDTVARFGGDEFVVVLSELDVNKAESTAQAGIVAEKIRTALAEPHVLRTRVKGKAKATVEHHSAASIGVVLFINHEASVEDILRWADTAMYQAKEAGRNQIRFYEPELRSRS